MNFFENQHKAKKNTRLMIVLFLIAMMLIVVGISWSVWLLSHLVGAGDLDSVMDVSLWAGASAAGIILLGSAWKIYTLRDGGDAVAISAGGKRVVRSTKDWHERRLFNIVEEMSIASGISMPRVYVLDNEKGINAFAAGFSPNAAAVAVTRGSLEKLNRQELQAVVAHEFSHILNGDMRLNIILIGVLHGLLVISLIGHFLMRITTVDTRSRDPRGSGGGGLFILILLGFVLYVLGYVGIFFGRIIKASVSREREYLADASAVQFTRQTEGISGALQKIAATSHGSYIWNSAKNEELSHMFFGAGDSLSSWFDTHPPILRRIRRVDKSFKPYMLEEKKKMWLNNDPDGKSEDEKQDNSKPEVGDKIKDAMSGGGAIIIPVLASMETNPSKISQSIGLVDDKSIEGARDLLKQIPEDIHDEIMDSENALNMILSFVNDKIDLNKTLHLKEIISIEKQNQYKEKLKDISNRVYIPIINLSVSSLRDLDKKKLRDLLRITAQVRNHKNATLMDYCFSQLLSNHIRGWLIPRGKIQNKTLAGCKDEVELLIGTLAGFSHASENDARKSYSKAYRYIYQKTPLKININKDLKKLENAWFNLKRLNEEGMKILVESLVVVIVDDGQILVEEEKILRLVCAILDCPLPYDLLKNN